MNYWQLAALAMLPSQFPQLAQQTASYTASLSQNPAAAQPQPQPQPNATQSYPPPIAAPTQQSYPLLPQQQQHQPIQPPHNQPNNGRDSRLASKQSLGCKKLFATNISASVTKEEFTKILEPYAQHGGVLDITFVKRVVSDTCYAFIEFETSADADACADALNYTTLHGHTIRVGPASKPNGIVSETNLYVEGIPIPWVNDDLREYFSKFGVITAARVLCTKGTNTSRGVGFVHFQTHEEAALAKEECEGQKPFPEAKRQLRLKFANKLRNRTPQKGGQRRREDTQFDEVCRYFLRGHCKRGRKCFYRHESGGDGGFFPEMDGYGYEMDRRGGYDEPPPPPYAPPDAYPPHMRGGGRMPPQPYQPNYGYSAYRRSPLPHEAMYGAPPVQPQTTSYAAYDPSQATATAAPAPYAGGNPYPPQYAAPNAVPQPPTAAAHPQATHPVTQQPSPYPVTYPPSYPTAYPAANPNYAAASARWAPY